jgi:hypothetical protein
MAMKPLQILLGFALICLLLLCSPVSAFAFCGFYVGKADAQLFNKASQVVIARDDKRTILTMANDYQGELKDFALVVPVPVLLKQEQVRVGDRKAIEHLDAFSAPRLVEYFDSDPCAQFEARTARLESQQFSTNTVLRGEAILAKKDLGVTVEAQFTVGEYDILMLSAKESDGLETWLTENGYRIPSGASELLQPYIRQNMKFFVAKVNLGEQQKTGVQFLRPLMIAYESPKFMLPIRLGMVNAVGDQDLIVYILSPKGQAEVLNYRTVKIPSDAEIPVYAKKEFPSFYKAMFKTAYDRQDRKVAFMEYAWDMSSCDPCSAEPLSTEELQKAGVFWLDIPNDGIPSFRSIRPQPSSNRVFITRIHVRYSRDKFPEDLIFKETSNNEFFQGRYILRHPFEGTATCDAGQQYKQSLIPRFEQEAKTMANLTGWNVWEIRRKMNIPVKTQSTPFWRNIWR